MTAVQQFLQLCGDAPAVSTMFANRYSSSGGVTDSGVAAHGGVADAAGSSSLDMARGAGGNAGAGAAGRRRSHSTPPPVTSSKPRSGAAQSAPGGGLDQAQPPALVDFMRWLSVACSDGHLAVNVPWIQALQQAGHGAQAQLVRDGEPSFPRMAASAFFGLRFVVLAVGPTPPVLPPWDTTTDNAAGTSSMAARITVALRRLLSDASPFMSHDGVNALVGALGDLALTSLADAATADDSDGGDLLAGRAVSPVVAAAPRGGGAGWADDDHMRHLISSLPPTPDQVSGGGSTSMPVPTPTRAESHPRGGRDTAAPKQASSAGGFSFFQSLTSVAAAGAWSLEAGVRFRLAAR